MSIDRTDSKVKNGQKVEAYLGKRLPQLTRLESGGANPATGIQNKPERMTYTWNIKNM